MIITKEDILRIAEPFEQMYGDMSNEILILMAEFIGQDIDEPIEVWQEKKIKQIQILLKMVQNIQKGYPYLRLINHALNETVDESLKEVEPVLKKGAEAGVLSVAGDIASSLSLNDLKKIKKQEFAKTFANMNAEMVNGVNQSFNKAITNVVVKYNQKTGRMYEILDDAVRKTLEGQARQEAVAEAIRQMIEENIPAFVDRAGRKWSAEAYANMYSRTNVHNMAIETVNKRNEDYGNDLIQVDKHAGARPLCAPYQGKIFSTSGRSGTVEDAFGKKHRFKPLSSTSYGEPAGLFGINCGHNPSPFVPKMSNLVAKPLTKEEEKENDRIYQESQQQRAIEREIRKAKTEEMALKKAGIDDKKAKQKVKDKEAKMKRFIKETGRTRRKDREEVIQLKEEKK